MPLGRIERTVEQKLRHGDHRAHRGAKLVADHGKEIGLGPVGGLGPLAQAPFGVDSLDKAFDPGKEIVGPEILRLHGFRSTVSVRSGHDSRNHLKVG